MKKKIILPIIIVSLLAGIVLFGILFSIGVGCLSGYFPARNAAKLKPVEALRGIE